MNSVQESEFNASIYHYLLWKSCQEESSARQDESHPVGASAGDLSRTRSPNKRKPPERYRDAGDKKLSGLALKYQRLAQAFQKEFPHVAQTCPPSLQNQVPPIITTLYETYPMLQQENIELKEQPTPSKKRKAPCDDEETSVTSPVDAEKSAAEAKEAKLKKKREKVRKTSVLSNVARRKDVPGDVKEIVKLVREKAQKEKRLAKAKISRLEEKMAKVQKEAAEAEKQRAAVAAAAAAAAQTASATPAEPPKPPTPPYTYRPRSPPPYVSFEERFEELVHFQKGNGHCRVPVRMPGLGGWVSEIRRLYRTAQEYPETLTGWFEGQRWMLTHERVAQLKEIGFEFTVVTPKMPWSERYQQLLEFKEKYGHTRVPRSCEEFQGLGDWVHTQRRNYAEKNPILEGERMTKLEEIGFEWRVGRAKATLEERLEECRDYRRKHGHLNVPGLSKREQKIKIQDSASAEEYSFRRWAQRQRDEYRKFKAGKKSTMDKQRIKKLEEIGFGWNVSVAGTKKGQDDMSTESE